jgi:hypothetical protein
MFEHIIQNKGGDQVGYSRESPTTNEYFDSNVACFPSKQKVFLGINATDIQQGRCVLHYGITLFPRVSISVGYSRVSPTTTQKVNGYLNSTCIPKTQKIIFQIFDNFKNVISHFSMKGLLLKIFPI